MPVRKVGVLLGVVVMAVLFGYVPAGAQGYTGGATCSLTPLNPSPGDSVTATGTGFKPGSEVAFTIEPGAVAGATATANSEGVATATFSLPSNLAPGAYTLVCSGIGVDDNQVNVTTNVNVAGTEAPPPPRQEPGNENLARTGFDVWNIARVGLVLFAAGAALFLITRKRRRHATPA